MLNVLLVTLNFVLKIIGWGWLGRKTEYCKFRQQKTAQKRMWEILSSLSPLPTQTKTRLYRGSYLTKHPNVYNIEKGNISFATFHLLRNGTLGCRRKYLHHHTHTIKMKEAREYFTLKDHLKYNASNFIRNLLNISFIYRLLVIP